MPKSAAELLAQRFPTLPSYWPNLQRVSAPQAAFLVLDCEEAFYGGAAGGGKSDALLAAALQYVHVPGYAALILRRTFSDLDLPGAAMDRAKAWLDGVAHWDAQRKTFTFPSNATLTFGYLQNETDKFRYKSSEFAFIGFDELTQFSQTQYEYLFTRLRATDDVPVPWRMRSASNPGDIGHGWVKRKFITDRDDGVIFVPAKLSDHPDASFRAGYHRSLAKLDEITRRQYEDGDWDVAAGLAYKIDRHAHLVGDIDIPDGWDRFESMDFGVANPTCVLAWAVDYDGNVICFDSYYRGDTLVSDHAREIEAKRAVWWPTGRLPVCYADPSMWARKGHVNRWGDPATDVTEFQEHGIRGLIQANNERRAGRIRVAEMLKIDAGHRYPDWHERAGETKAPRLYFVSAKCPELVEQLQAAPLLAIESARTGAGEIVDPDWESQHGHAVAAARYGLMSRPEAASEPELPLDDPRAELLRQYVKRRDSNEQSRPNYELV